MGPYTLTLRTLRGDLEAAQRTQTVLIALNAAALKAEAYDREPSVQALEQLRAATERAEDVLEAYMARLSKVAHGLNVVITQLIETDTSGMPDRPAPLESMMPGVDDDELVDRLGVLYGIPKPRRYRRD